MGIPVGVSTPKLTGGLSVQIGYIAMKVYNERGQKIGDVINQGDGRGWEAHRKGRTLAGGEDLQGAAELIEAAWQSGN